MRTSEILNKAADQIQARGWTQVFGWNTCDRTPLCLEGGIQAAMGLRHASSMLDEYDLFRTCPAYRAVVSYLGQDGNQIFMAYDYNDAPGRTKAEVIEVLRAAAVIEEAKEKADEKVEEEALV